MTREKTQKPAIKCPHRKFSNQPQGFRVWFISSYLVIAAGVTMAFNALFSSEGHVLRNNLFIFVLVALLNLYEIRRELVWKHHLKLPLRITGFGLQILLVEGIHTIQHSRDSWILYPYLVFSSYFQFGKRVSLPLVGALIVLTVLQVHIQDSVWARNPGGMLFVISRIIIIVFFQILALMFHREEEERKKSEKLLRDLEESNRQLHKYSVQAVNLAAVEERNRIAREIHDSVGHFLTVTNIQLEKAMAYQERDPAQARQAMKDAKWAATEALRDVRESIHTLREKTDEFLFEDAVKRLTARMPFDAPVVHIEFLGDYRQYNRTILMALYRVIQEGITNVQKHAGAEEVSIRCEFTGDTAELTIRDNGKGFNTSRLSLVPGREGGYGLTGLVERLDLVRGRMEVISTPGEGTSIHVLIPREMS